MILVDDRSLMAASPPSCGRSLLRRCQMHQSPRCKPSGACCSSLALLRIRTFEHAASYEINGHACCLTRTAFVRCRQLDILHTTLARLLKPPKGHGKAAARRLDAAMHALTQELCGLETTLRELWYIQERHLLALALNGRVRQGACAAAVPAEPAAAVIRFCRCKHMYNPQVLYKNVLASEACGMAKARSVAWQRSTSCRPCCAAPSPCWARVRGSDTDQIT